VSDGPAKPDRNGITPERVAELTAELGFLDLCALVLAYSKTSTMNISWKHPSGVTVSIQERKNPRKAKARKVAS